MSDSKERPILFSGAMVVAILDGSKTQTRRVAKLTPAGHVKEPRGHRRWHPGDPEAVSACPYGQPGDRLWVRETVDALCGCDAEYQADGVRLVDGHPDRWDIWREGRSLPARTVPSIHMPRWASRLTLEITDRRLQRLQDISEEDARAEGHTPGHLVASPRVWFSTLWDSISAERGVGWSANPIVWELTFRRAA